MNKVNRNTKRNNHNYGYDSSFYAYGYAYNRQCKTEICFLQLNEVVCRSEDYLCTYSTLLKLVYGPAVCTYFQNFK